ncbi:MAG: Sec-independent protein translocase protein TatB [Asticcacaulis sp.]
MVPGIGGGELILIAVVALVIVGPKDLPKLLRQLGRYVGKMRRMADDFRTSFDDMARQSELDDLRKEVEALRTGKVQAIEDINTEVSSIGSDIQSSLRPEKAYYAGSGEMTPLETPEIVPETVVPEGYDDQMAGLPPKDKSAEAAPAETPPSKPKRVRKPATKAVAKTAEPPKVAEPPKPKAPVKRSTVKKPATKPVSKPVSKGDAT